MDHLVNLLADPEVRLLNLHPNGDHEMLLISKRVPAVRTALDAVIVLAERLATQGHNRRALELLTQVLYHPKCDASLKAKVKTLRASLFEQVSDPTAETK